MYRRHDKNFYLFILAYALVEIRGRGWLHDDSMADFPTKVADILHHIPEGLTLELDEERDKRLYERLIAKAQIHGLSDLIAGWEQTALRRANEYH
jgi:hypothetical protein